MTGMTRRDVLLYLLGGFFVTNAIVAELIGGKLIQAGPFIMSVGVIPWPAVFLATVLVWGCRRFRSALEAALIMVAIFGVVLLYHVFGLLVLS